MDGQGSTSNWNRREKDLKQGDDMPKEVEDESQVEVDQICFDDLPPEMLEEIMKKLDVSSLLSCRLVSRKLNELSREPLNSLAWIKVVPVEKKFENVNNPETDFLVKHNQNLYKFIECFEKSKNFPFSHYRFELVYKQIDLQVLKSFISDSRNSIKGLNLRILDICSGEDLNESIYYVRDLLFNQLPNLEEFGLRLAFDPYRRNVEHSLFPRSKGQVKSGQLPKLKIIRLSPSLLHLFPRLVTDVFEAAINLKKIEPAQDFEPFATLDQFQFFHSLGKLDVLQTAQMSPSVELWAWIKDSFYSDKHAEFKLSRMALLKPGTTSVSLSPFIETSEMTAFVNHLFDSCTDTLKELQVGSWEFLESIRLSKFTKLRVLDFSRLAWIDGISFDDPIPSIRTLRVSTATVNEPSIRKMEMLCPNLKELQVLGDVCHFPDAALSIWTHMTNVESLTFNLMIYTDFEKSCMVDVNSIITGISKENCQLLLENIKAREKPMTMSRKLEIEKSLKMTEIEKIREQASILDLKDLRSLSFEITMGRNLSGWNNRSFFSVSKLFAFNLMPFTSVSTRLC